MYSQSYMIIWYGKKQDSFQIISSLFNAWFSLKEKFFQVSMYISMLVVPNSMHNFYHVPYVFNFAGDLYSCSGSHDYESWPNTHTSVIC